MQTDTILVIGANGQIGTELVSELRKVYGTNQVIASDLNNPGDNRHGEGPFETLNILDKSRFNELIKKYKVNQVYLLAALLSATAEKNHHFAWELNMNSLLTVLDAAVEYKFSKIYWPSSIAVFGPTTPRIMTPQHTIMDPNTIYGITKLAGERLCEYYYNKFGVDTRSLRYPGIIGWKAAPGGGTTDYAVHIYHEALKNNSYTSFLGPDTRLPMIYMPDALRATLTLMEKEAVYIKIRSSYNLAGCSFTPAEVAESIKKKLPGFSISYLQGDARQKIADSWPASIDDSMAREQWGWQHAFNLDEMTTDMLDHLSSFNQKSTELSTG